MTFKFGLMTAVTLVGSTALSANCPVYGCKRYATSNGYCSLHQDEYKRAVAKRAAEAAEVRAAVREHNAAVRANEEAAAAIAAQAKEKENQLKAQQRKLSAAERAKFEQPLDGLFGRKFGERQGAGVSSFVPATPYRSFTDYTTLSEGTNGIVRIAAHADFGSDAEIARRELNLVLDDLADQYGRKLNKIFTKNCDEVWVLGFGGEKGVAHQQIEVTILPRGTGYRIELAGFVIRRPQKTLTRWTPALGDGAAK